MIDIHVHLLPGIDDGPRDTAESLAMCRAAAADGIEIAVATPHQRHELWPGLHRADLEPVHRELAAAAEGFLDVRLGAELRVDSELLDEVEDIPGNGLLTLAGSHYLLLELHPMPFGPDPLELVDEVVHAGWRPIIAHPERIRWLAEEPELLAELVRCGAALQITAAALVGGFPGRTFECCCDLMDAGLVHFVASDGHRPDTRPPYLSEAYDAVRSGWGEAVAERLFVTNPRAVLDDRPLP